MHAALDRAGIGIPCGIVARFNRNESEVDSAIAAARRRFPVLQTKLTWKAGRPVLETGASANRDLGTGPLLRFSASQVGDIWKYRLIPQGHCTWLHAVWMHGAADGLSMLRFVQALATGRNNEIVVPEHRAIRQPRAQQQFAAWLPKFLLDQSRSYVGVTQPAARVPEVSWISASIADRDRVMRLACTSNEGMAGWLAAAVALAFADQQDNKSGNIILNVPIARDELKQTKGFGFGVGSLRFSVEVGKNLTVPALASVIGRRLKQLADRGWDRNLERFLSSNPARHARFSRIEARRPNPNITISWKGHHANLGVNGGPLEVACFAAAPTLHVSAHTDSGGLSLSVTSRQPASERKYLLLQIARLIGCQSDLAVRELDGMNARKSAIDITEVAMI